MNKSSFKLEIKEMGSTEGTFTGLASVYGNKDLGGDVVMPGAFAKTLNDKNGEVPILWQHDTSEPIGLGKLSDSSDGLQIKGELVLESSVAQKAYALMRRGVLKGLSIGYDTIKEDIKDSTRFLKELKLWEVSLVTFPMNQAAGVQSVKRVEEEFRADLVEFITAEKAQFKALNQALAEQSAAEVQALIDRLAATLQKEAPEFFHASFDRMNTISELLRG